MNLTHEKLLELIEYNPETGNFTSRVGRVGVSIGMSLGCVHKTIGYVFVGLKKKRYLCHRLAWFYVHGVWPPEQVDHINGNRSDNRIVNLRLASIAENRRNAKKRSDNTSGHKGVYLHQPGVWRARIGSNGKLIDLGLFSSPEEAYRVRCEALPSVHGLFARAG